MTSGLLRPRTIGSVAPVTHEITSAPATAASRSMTSTVNPCTATSSATRSLGGITAPDLHRVEVTHVCVRLHRHRGQGTGTDHEQLGASARASRWPPPPRRPRCAGRQRVRLTGTDERPGRPVEQQHARLHHREVLRPVVGEDGHRLHADDLAGHPARLQKERRVVAVAVGHGVQRASRRDRVGFDEDLLDRVDQRTPRQRRTDVGVGEEPRIVALLRLTRRLARPVPIGGIGGYQSSTVTPSPSAIRLTCA